MGSGGLTSLLVAMSFGGHFGIPVPIAAHRLIGQFVPYQRMRCDWHALVKKATKTDLLWQVCCAIVRAAAGCFVVVFWLSYDTQDVEYTTPTTPIPSPECKFSPHRGMGMKWHPIKTNDMWTKSANWCVFTCAQWGVWELEEGLHNWGESRCFIPLVFFLLHDKYDRGRG